MRLVVDTNVVLSGFLSVGGPPARIMNAVRDGTVTVLWDDRILSEYADVLGRPKFGLDAAAVTALLDKVRVDGERIAVTARYTGRAPDPDDVCFIEVALAGRADAIVTGNARDFPPECGVVVMTPAEIVARLGPPHVA